MQKVLLYLWSYGTAKILKCAKEGSGINIKNFVNDATSPLELSSTVPRVVAFEKIYTPTFSLQALVITSRITKNGLLILPQFLLPMLITLYDIPSGLLNLRVMT